MAQWIARLDRDTGVSGQRLFVYHVQNGKASELAAVLGQVFAQERSSGPPPVKLAPGLQAAQRSSAAATAEASVAAKDKPAAEPRANPVSTNANSGGLSITPTSEIRIIADEVNNALLILANGQQYRQVESALRELDIVPLQVLIEATIAEVSLTGELSQGLEWFFKNHLGKGDTGTASLDVGAAGLAALVPGFSYSITEASTVKAVLNVLAQDSRANIISSPSLMVLNNQTATIQVGDQVPITIQQQQSTATTSNVVNSIEFRDTGVLLKVTPRVNAGGLVIMEIEQEVSNVAPGDAGTLTPIIQQRRISSTVAVQSAETVVLGGLIRENTSNISSGIPGLYQLPILGKLFGSSTDQASRTELVVLITPRAVQGVDAARDVTDEFRRRMESLKPLSPAGKTGRGKAGTKLGAANAPSALEAPATSPAPIPTVTPALRPAEPPLRFEPVLTPGPLRQPVQGPLLAPLMSRVREHAPLGDWTVGDDALKLTLSDIVYKPTLQSQSKQALAAAHKLGSDPARSAPSWWNDLRQLWNASVASSEF